MRDGLRWFRNGVLILIGTVALVYLGACVYANFLAGDGTVKLPDVNKAQYAVQIQSTGQILLSDKVDHQGSVYTLYNYYEYNGKKFLYRKATLALDETYFGKIDVSKRTVQ